MSGGRVAGLVVLTALALLLALGLVPWRQSRALEALGELDRLERELELARAERDEQAERVTRLESRDRVLEEARERLGLRLPSADEVVILGSAGSGSGEGAEWGAGSDDVAGEEGR